MENEKIALLTIRGVNFKLMTYTRSLELCARMNYELENLDFIDEIKEDEILFDLGACEGRFSVYAAKKGITVFSFEPENMNYSVLLENIKLNNLTGKVFPINSGVGDIDGELSMKIGQPWAGGHQKVIDFGISRNDLNFDFIEKQMISVCRLDTFIKNTGVFPNYLKIDVDGSEVPFLKGALNVLSSTLLKAIIIELNILDLSFNQIEESLMKFGFKEEQRHQVPNEPFLYNIIYKK